MLESATCVLTEAEKVIYADAWGARDPARLPPDVPRWRFLRWLEAQGVLLHGSRDGGLAQLEPQVKDYGQPDDFSNRTGVYATSDGVWAMMYALRGPCVTGLMDMGLRQRDGDSWSAMRYFMSVGMDGPGHTDGRALLAPGTVYVLDAAGFEPSPPYVHPGLGEVQEAHWVSPVAVRPLLAVPVAPTDFPLPVRVHDTAVIRERARREPWGFPWLET